MLATPLQSVANGSGIAMLLPQSSMSTANVYVGTQVIVGPVVSSLIIISALVVAVTPHSSVTVQVIVSDPPHTSGSVPSKSFVTVVN